MSQAIVCPVTVKGKTNLNPALLGSLVGREVGKAEGKDDGLEVGYAECAMKISKPVIIKAEPVAGSAYMEVLRSRLLPAALPATVWSSFEITALSFTTTSGAPSRSLTSA